MRCSGFGFIECHLVDGPIFDRVEEASDLLHVGVADAVDDPDEGETVQLGVLGLHYSPRKLPLYHRHPEILEFFFRYFLRVLENFGTFVGFYFNICSGLCYGMISFSEGSKSTMLLLHC